MPRKRRTVGQERGRGQPILSTAPTKGEAQVSLSSMPAAMNGSPLPRVRGKLGNAYYDMLLDSGSSISLVNVKDTG